MISHFAGARWWKFDFHAHTPASRDTPWFSRRGKEDELTPERWLLRFMKAGIDCVAVTDHNTGEWIDRLKAAYEALKSERPDGFRPLRLFPGVELSVNGGFHLLAIFDPAAAGQEVHDLLVKVGFDGTPGDSNGVTRKSAVQVIEIVQQSGALAIPAHVDGRKGLLRLDPGTKELVLDYNTVKQVMQCPGILAAEVVDPGWTRHEVYTETKCRWTEVVGSDCHNFRSGSQPGERFTWVKLCDPPDLEGLRLALLDGEPLSIRQSHAQHDDPNEHPRLALEQIDIRDLRHAGRGRPLVARFSPWLSTLIGGRGTGKSTVIELLRMALDREPDPWGAGSLQEATSNFERTKKALLDETAIEVLAQKEGARYGVRWGEGGVRTIEEETAPGRWEEAPGTVRSRFPVRIFSQKEIFSLAEEPGALLDLVDEAEAVGFVDWKSRWKELENRFLRLRSQIRELGTRIGERERLAGELEDVKRQLAVFEEGTNKDLLVRYQRLRRQRAAFEDRREELADAIERLRNVAEEIEPADMRGDVFFAEDPTSNEALQLLAEASSKQRSVLEKLIELSDELWRFNDSWWERVESSSWAKSAREIEHRYEELVERLREEGVEDPSAYGAVIQRRTTLERRLAEIDAIARRQEGLEKDARKTLQELEQWRLNLTKRRRRFLEAALEGNQYVRISLIPFGNGAKASEASFRRALSREDGRLESDILAEEDGGQDAGLLADLYASLPEDPEERLKVFCERQAELKRQIVGITLGKDVEGRTKWFHNHVRDLQPEQLDRLELWWPEDGLRVEYRRPDGTFASVEEGSPGQKSAAILAFVLSYGHEPLILDQPEDDLDNHLIYDLIVAQIRENKIRRQVIVATHNPNIVVNGDAEMVIAMDQRGGQCVVVPDGSGCLQSKGVRDEVCRVMEGGREAFERRYRRIIGGEVRDVRHT